MRAVVQRVSSALVRVGGEVVGEIGRGLVVYAGVAPGDGESDLEFIAGKLRYLRVFADGEGKMNLDVAQVGGGILLISNFTLLADTSQGRRPAFTSAAAPEVARPLFDRLCERVRAMGVVVETGRFGEHMEIESVADGPVNVVLESRRP